MEFSERRDSLKNAFVEPAKHTNVWTDHPLAEHLRDLVGAPRPSHRVNRPAQALMPPFRLMNCSSGSESRLYAAA